MEAERENSAIQLSRSYEGNPCGLVASCYCDADGIFKNFFAVTNQQINVSPTSSPIKRRPSFRQRNHTLLKVVFASTSAWVAWLDLEQEFWDIQDHTNARSVRPDFPRRAKCNL